MRSPENQPQFLDLAAELAARHGLSVVEVLTILSSKEAREKCSGLRSLFRHPHQKNGKNGRNGKHDHSTPDPNQGTL